MTTEPLTNLSANELEDFFLLLPRIYADYRDPQRGPLGMLYVYSETPDNEDSSFKRAIELADAGLVKNLGLAGSAGESGYAGYDHSIKRLIALGWRQRVQIMEFCMQGRKLNTLSEAKMLASWADTRGRGEDIGIVAPPFHLVRTFMTTVSAMRENPVRVYAYPGVAISWSENVVHSQGIVRDTRAGLLVGELKRLETYRAPNYGNMATAREVLEYLKWRDG